MQKFRNKSRSLSGYVTAQRKAWVQSNPTRLKYELGVMAKLLAAASDGPGRWVSALTIAVLVFTGLTLTAFGTPPYRGYIDFGPSSGFAPSTYFFGLWAVQTAMVAVVYPIVVAFVTVLIQKQSASKASLKAFFSTSSATLTGLSSLGLVLVMAMQLLLLDSIVNDQAFSWLMVDGIWFVINTALSIRFLLKTFEFASPEGRTRARNDYALKVAWPDEAAYHLSRLAGREPITHGLLNLADATTEREAQSAAFSSTPKRFGGAPTLLVNFRGVRAVEDVRYAVLEWAFRRWVQTCGSSAPAVGRSRSSAAFSRDGAVLEMGVPLRQEFSHREPLFLSNRSAKPDFFTRLALRASLKFSSSASVPSVRVADVLDECGADVASAIRDDSEAEFTRRLLELLKFLDQVIESSYTEQAGTPDNWVLLADTDDVGESPLVLTWLRVLLDLHSSALSAMSVRSGFAERTIRAPARFFSRQRGHLTADLQAEYLRVQFWAMLRALEWGAEGCAGATEASRSDGLLDEPLRRRYERLLKEGLGAWETIKNLHLRVPDGADWAAMQEIAPLVETHLRDSGFLVVRAAQALDRTGLVLLLDSLLKWQRQVERFGHRSGLHLNDQFRLTYEYLLVPLEEVRQQIPLPPHEAEGPETLRELWFTATGNLWRDVTAIAAASVLMEARNNEAMRPLARVIVRATLLGQPALFDSAAAESETIASSADEFLFGLVRQRVLDARWGSGYYSRLEKIADSFAPNAAAEGISGRTYAVAGSGLSRLQEPMLLMLLTLVSGEWHPVRSFESLIREWHQVDELRRRLRDLLLALEVRFGQPDFVESNSALWNALEVGDADSLAVRAADARRGINELLARLSAVRTEDIRRAEISEVALGALSDFATPAFSRRDGYVPATLFRHLRLGAHGGGREPVARSLRVAGWEKGSITETVFATPVANQAEFVLDVIRQAVAQEALRDILAAEPTATIGVDSRIEFETTVIDFGREQVEENRSPLLLVPSRSDPSWLREMSRGGTRANEEGATLRVLPEVNRDQGYIGHVGDTAVYETPSLRGLYLLCTRDMFEALVFGGNADAPVDVSAEDEPGGTTCTLTFSWSQIALLSGATTLRLARSLPRG